MDEGWRLVLANDEQMTVTHYAWVPDNVAGIEAVCKSLLKVGSLELPPSECRSGHLNASCIFAPREMSERRRPGSQRPANLSKVESRKSRAPWIETSIGPS
jgi:hypothetical protein